MHKFFRQILCRIKKKQLVKVVNDQMFASDDIQYTKMRCSTVANTTNEHIN